MITAPTVLGRRTVDTSRVRVWRARMPGRGVDAEVLVLRSPRLRLLILVASGIWATSALPALGEAPVPAWRLYLRGVALIFASAVSAFLVLGLGADAAGVI